MSLPADILKILNDKTLRGFLDACGEDAEVFLVGGAVRDAFDNRLITDLDFAINKNPEEIISNLKNHFRVIETGISHGTVTVLLPSYHFTHLELTSFRKPSSRKEHIRGDTIQEDLSGRDFTINAIAINARTLELIDPCGGVKAIHDHELIAVQNASDRFKEDPLRMMRAIRLGPGEKRKVSSDITNAIATHKKLIHEVSVERIRDELEKILLSSDPRSAFRMLSTTGLLEEILPELTPTVGFEQNDFHHEDVFEHTLTVVERSEKEKILRFASLLHDIGKPASLAIREDGKRTFYLHEKIGAETAKSILERLKFSSKEVTTISRLVEYHMRPVDCGPSAVRRLLRDLEEDFILWRKLKYADAPPSESEEEYTKRLAVFDAMVEDELEKQKISHYKKLAINGNDLLTLGIPPGPKMGSLLKLAEDAVIENPECNTKEHLLSLISKSMS